MGDARENILWVHPRVRVVASRVGVAWCVTCSVLVLCVSLRASRRGRVEACAKMRDDGGMGFGFATRLTTDARVRTRVVRFVGLVG